VLNKEAGEVDDITLVRDNDHLYVVSESQGQPEPQGEGPWLKLPSDCWLGFRFWMLHAQLVGD
jgi:hypothetical protein